MSLSLPGIRKKLRFAEHGSAEQFNSKLESSNQFFIMFGNIVIEHKNQILSLKSLHFPQTRGTKKASCCAVYK